MPVLSIAVFPCPSSASSLPDSELELLLLLGLERPWILFLLASASWPCFDAVLEYAVKDFC